MLVISRQENFADDDHSIDYEFLHVGLIHPRDGWIAPSAQIESAASTSEFTLKENIFCTSDSTNDDPFEADIDGFSVGDFVDLVDQYGTFRAGTKKIDAIVGNTITLVSGFAVIPVAGDILRSAQYSSASAAQQSDWIYIADSSNELDGDLPKTYRS